ncbi:MAG: hypothetical protein GQ559_02610 [Desulfobulbaceae bacterium]|nr:hypothetical protein [Desulfobulbaceae bacterium]
MLRRIGFWFITGCRVLVGILVMKTGFDFAYTGGFSYSSSHENFITGAFVMIIGAYFIGSSLFNAFFNK